MVCTNEWLATGKLKGSIYCAGLSAYEFSADDVTKIY